MEAHGPGGAGVDDPPVFEDVGREGEVEEQRGGVVGVGGNCYAENVNGLIITVVTIRVRSGSGEVGRGAGEVLEFLGPENGF